MGEWELLGWRGAGELVEESCDEMGVVYLDGKFHKDVLCLDVVLANAGNATMLATRTEKTGVATNDPATDTINEEQ